MNIDTVLKKWINENLSRLDKLLLILSSFENGVQVREIISKASSVGLHGLRTWNISDILGRSKGHALRADKGWEIAELGRHRLKSLGITIPSSSESQVSRDFRQMLSETADKSARSFFEEAIVCFETRLYRSAIVMSWVAAVYVLRPYVLTSCLDEFNSEARRVHPKWKDAKTADDLGLMREADFLDRICGLSIIGKSQKAELKACLDRRNGCGHPSSLEFGESGVAYHLEALLLNVFNRYAV